MGINHLEQPAKMSSSNPRCHLPFDQEVEALHKLLQVKWIAEQSWSKVTKDNDNTNEVPWHPQNLDPQGVDTDNACPPISYLERLPIEVHSRIFTMERKVGGQITTT
jgi:hypothetical protein